MKNWPPVLWAVFFALIGFLGAFGDVLFKLYSSIDILKYYLLWGVALGSFFYLMGKNATDTHIHHYVLAMIVLSFTCYQTPFVTLVHGVFNGIMIEGGSRWGYDPIWTYGPKKAAKQDSAAIRYQNFELTRLQTAHDNRIKY